MKLNIRKYKIIIGFPFFAAITYFLSDEMFENILYAMLFSLFHEAGHIVALIFFGGKPEKLTVGIMGLKLTMENSFLSYRHEVTSALCGPIVNLVFMIIFFFTSCTLPFVINCGLFIINMLPVRFLDGGRILYFALVKKYGISIASKVLNITEMCSVLLLVSIMTASLIADFCNTSFVIFTLGLCFFTAVSLIKNKDSEMI